MSKPIDPGISDGQEADDAAFEAMVARFKRQRTLPTVLTSLYLEGLRFAWDAGRKHGLEMRGCCMSEEEAVDEHDDYGAIPEECGWPHRSLLPARIDALGADSRHREPQEGVQR